MNDLGRRSAAHCSAAWVPEAAVRKLGTTPLAHDLYFEFDIVVGKLDRHIAHGDRYIAVVGIAT